MQFFNNFTKVFIFSLIILLNFSISLQCENSCQECQRTVYQLKFQGAADCHTFTCKDTCFKVKESWNNPLNIFEFFKKDVFGKCEICFRAGHCNLTQCDQQKNQELEIINNVISHSKLTAMIPGNPLIGVVNTQVDKKGLNVLKNKNEQIAGLIENSLKKALTNKSLNKFQNYLKDLYHSYFDSPFAMPKDTEEVLAKFNKDNQVTLDDINDDKVIKSYSVLSTLEDRITELEGMASEYKNNKKGKSLDKSVRNRISNVVSSMKQDFKKYQLTFDNNISKLDKTKIKIRKLKSDVSALGMNNKDKDSEEIIKIEEKVEKMDNSMKKMENEISMKKEKLKNILKAFK